jgi:hypothetical protein
MDDDIDLFAELGVDPSPAPDAAAGDDLLGLLAEHDASGSSPQEADPLSALMDDDEEQSVPDLPVVQAEPIPHPEPTEPMPVVQAELAPPSHSLSEAMLGNIVALLVERGLGVDPRRLGLHDGANVVVDRVAVEREEDLLIARVDVHIDGVDMHPFAAVQLTVDGATPLAAPASLPAAWHAMHNALATCLEDGAKQLDAALGGAWRS